MAIKLIKRVCGAKEGDNMENKNLKMLLALSITSACNLRCFYCRAAGESLDNSLGTINYDLLKDIIISAYDNGIKNFRITGGEPTIALYFGELIEFIMKLAPDTIVRITTNGYKIKEYIDIIERYKERIEVVISVDSLNEYIGDIKYEKYLSEKVIDATEALLKRKIKVRYNIVVTRENINSVPELILKSLDLGVNLKLLDLIKHEEYFEKNTVKESSEFFRNSYQSIEDIKEFLKSITDRYQDNFSMLVSTGIPMSGYFKGNQYIQVKDSSKGSSFSDKCVNECPFFSNCQEGMFGPFISNNGVLSISNCRNKKLRWDLAKMNKEERDKSFKEIIALFSDTKIYNNFEMSKNKGDQNE